MLCRIKRQYFKEVRCVRAVNWRKHELECMRLTADCMQLAERRSEPCFAVAFRSDGEKMVQFSGSGLTRSRTTRKFRLKT